MRKRVSVSDVRMGMFIDELCGPWIHHPFWKTRFVLSTPRDLVRLRKSPVKHVWIDPSKGLDTERGITAPQDHGATEAEVLLDDAATAGRLPERVALEEEIERAARICSQSKAAVMDMFRDVRMGKAIDTATMADLVEEISSSVIRQPGALISLARLKNADEYTYMHSVAVCAMMVALARQLDLTDDQVREAGMAGLLHDVGKAKVPDGILNKPGRLTEPEFAAIKRHPELGFALLRANQTVGAGALDVCLHHHEKVDGSGYPGGLTGDRISLYAKMGAVCDVYDAITSNRPYKQGWDPAESIKKMAGWHGHFDDAVFQAFVKSIGIYPTGSLVRLTSGRIGVVIEQTPDRLLAPRVKVFFSANAKAPIPPKLIDLARPTASEKIVGLESSAAWGFVNLHRIWSGLDHPAA